MKAKKLPEPIFYTVGGLAEKWGCGKEYILNLALTGQLQMSVESRGWWLEMGSIEEDEETGWFTIPDDFKLSNGELLRLSIRDQKEIISKGAVSDPSFKNDDFDYMRISSHHHPEEGIVIDAGDLVIDKSEIDIIDRSDNPKVLELTEDDLPTQKRTNELHELIGKIILDIKQADERPTAGKLWKHIKDHQDQYEIIQRVEICNETKEEAIFWISSYGAEQRMIKSTFGNIVSAFNRGKKSLK